MLHTYTSNTLQSKFENRRTRFIRHTYSNALKQVLGSKITEKDSHCNIKKLTKVALRQSNDMLI